MSAFEDEDDELFEDTGENDQCDHGCYPSEICDFCEELGCGWSEDDPTCICWSREVDGEE